MFIASPGGLEDERRRFRRILLEFNADDAQERGITFIPTGWEVTIAGRGRPQELLNQQVRESDYMILVLWDRWGSPPAIEGKFTSGTEEEYNVARKCLDAGETPMKDIVVLFKGVDERQLSDPGDQLQQVLAFKSTLEEEKALLYSNFDTIDEFEREVRRHLQRWTRDHEQGGGKTDRPPAPPVPPSGTRIRPPDGSGVDAEEKDVLDIAEGHAKRGELLEAEAAFAQAIASRSDDPNVLTRYGVFLRRNGRFAHAEAIEERLLRVGKRLNDPHIIADALGNLAITRRKRGHLQEARQLLEQAISVAEEGRVEKDDLAFLYDNLGLTLRRLGDFSRAEEHHRTALAIREASQDRRGMANALNNLGYLYRERADIVRALEAHKKALSLFDEVDDRRGQAAAHANLGVIYELRGDLDSAEREYRASLALNKELNSSDGLGMNYSQLSRVLLDRGDVESAEEFAQRCLEINERAGNREGIAGALHAAGRVDLARGELHEASQALRAAHEAFRAIGHRVGMAGTLRDLALATHALGQSADAVRLISEAREIAASIEHPRLKGQIDDAMSTIL